jgi:hypothetical protein
MLSWMKITLYHCLFGVEWYCSILALKLYIISRIRLVTSLDPADVNRGGADLP